MAICNAPVIWDGLPPADWVIDAAANASVLAGVDGATSPRQIVEHNLIGTLNLLEYCRRHKAGLVLLSSSRVYTVEALRSIPVVDAIPTHSPWARRVAPRIGVEGNKRGLPDRSAGLPLRHDQACVRGAGHRVRGRLRRTVVDQSVRCSGRAGQFGQPAQGIFTWWIHRWSRRRALSYLGFGGRGLQVRDLLHPSDLATLVVRQLGDTGTKWERGSST